MLYSWQAIFLEASPLHLSGRFLVCVAIGKFVGPHSFTWLTNAEHTIASLYNSILFLLVIAYGLFIFLSSCVHKAKRQMQIIQLSGAINGILQNLIRKKEI